jgi:CheY-like chemotaxis protein
LSLIGNIEDLSLPDILQIISLSKKSGLLTIRRGVEEGHIYLRQGKVILTFCPSIKRNLGSILLEKGSIQKTDLSAALEKQNEGGGEKLLGNILVEMGALDRATLDQMVQEQIEESIFYFLTWEEGTFKFDLREVDTRHEVGIDPNTVISQKGIDTQWLILEGTRMLDEHRRMGTVPVPEAAPEEGDEVKVPSVIVLVDDDEYFRDLFSRAVSKKGTTVQSFNGVTEAKEFLSSPEQPERISMVLDVVMPTSDGRGFLGGLELAAILTSEYPNINYQVITGYPDDSIRDKLRGLDAAPYMLKPELGGGDQAEAAMDDFAESLVRVLAAPSAPPKAAAEQPGESVEVEPQKPAVTIAGRLAESVDRVLKRVEAHPALKPMITDMVKEIEQAQSVSEIGLIILRLSSEIFDRAVLFRSDRQRAHGLGGFGFQAPVMNNREGLRNLVIDLKNSASLAAAAEKLEPLTGSSHQIDGDDLINLVLGRPQSKEWIIIPVKGPEETLLLLYADHGVSERSIEEGDMLEDFMSLAGLSMEKIYREPNEPVGGDTGRATDPMRENGGERFE